MIKEKNKDLVIVFALFCAAFLVYANSLSNGFVWDDDVVILANESLKGDPVALFRGIDSGRPSEITPYYRPLTLLSFYAERHLHGFAPHFVRIFNVLLHALNSILLFRLIRSFNVNRYASVVASLLFVVHPINSEAVDFNSGGRNTMLAAFFVLSSYLVHNWSLKRSSILGVISGAVLFLAGAFSKETALALLPFIYFSASWYRRPLKDATLLKYIIWFAPYLACTAIYLILRNNALSLAGASIDIWPGLAERLQNNLFIIPRYLLNIVWPWMLSPKYYIPEDLHQYALPLLVAWIAIGSVFWWLFFRRKSRLSFFGMAWLAVFWLPVSGVFPIPSAPLADRYMYLPAIGLWLVIADQLGHMNVDVHPKLDWRRIIPGLCVIFLSVTTVQHNLTWRNDIQLFSRLIEQYPDQAYGYHNLGCAYMDKVRDLDMAEKSFEQALALDPLFPRLRTQMGYARLLRGDFAGAIEHYEHAIYQNPQDAEALLNNGEALERLNRIDEAMESYRRFLAVPGNELPKARSAVKYKLEMLRQSLGHK